MGEYSRYLFQLDKDDNQQKQIHCSLCRNRVSFAIIVAHERPLARRGAASGRKELRLCRKCVDVISGPPIARM